MAAIVGLALGISGCSSSAPAASAAPPPDDDKPTYVDVAPPADCPAGTRFVAGETSCAPVGVRSCALGFAPTLLGGCREIQPKDACTGASREALGQASCVPLGDCDAAFPPAEASFFVDANLPAAQVDGSHFRTIGAAVAAAPSGATIAVERGTYSESIQVTAPVRIVGRCARDVVVTSPTGTSAGIQAGSLDVLVRGLTLRGHRGGVVSVTHGAATVEECLLDKNRLGGAVVSTGSLTLVRTRIVDTVDLDGLGGSGVLVQHGTATVNDSAVVRSVETGVAGIFSDARISLVRSIVRDTLPSVAVPGKSGAGVALLDGAQVDVTESAVTSSRTSGVEAPDPKCAARIDRSVIRDVAPDAFGLYAFTGSAQSRGLVNRGGFSRDSQEDTKTGS